MKSVLNYIQSIPRNVVLWTLIVITVAVILLKFLASAAILNAKEMNLSVIIQDAIDKLKLQQNKEKIKDLEPKKEDLKKDPKEIEDFYKNRK